MSTQDKQPLLIHKYIVQEIIPHFFTSLCVLSAVLVVSQLVRLSEVLIAFGITLENVFLPFLFIVLPFLSFTIPMALLFAVLLTFSRLSADGEYTALLAAGFSLRRSAVPVMVIAAVAYGASALCATYLEPWGRRELVQFYHRKAQTELDNMIRYRLQPGVFLDDFLGYVLYAEQISPDRSRLDNVMVAPGRRSQQAFTLLAPTGSVSGSVEGGNLKMSFDYGVIYSTRPNSDQTSVIKFKKAEIDLLRIFQDQILGDDAASDDYRSYSPGQLWTYIGELKDAANRDDSLYYKARYLLHQRIAIPFAAIVFAMFAMVLGVQDQRRGKSWTYAGAIMTIVLGYVLMMGFKWLAERGVLPAPVAAWIPNFMLLGIASFLVYQKNRLPPSESTLDPANIPWLNRHLQKTKPA